MKILKDLFKKESSLNRVLDEKTIFYLFQKIIQKKYGERGREMIQPAFYKNQILGIRTKSPLWANELWLTKNELLQSLKSEIGSEEAVKELKFLH